MERKKALELKVGIFALIAIVILFIIIFSIGDVYLFIRPGYNIKAIFGFVSGLDVASPVRLAGVTVGEVKDLKVFYDEADHRTKVEALVWLKRDVNIRKDAEFYINTLGFLGEKYIEIISAGPEEVGFLSSGDTVMGRDPVPIEKLTMMGQAITAQLSEGLEALNEVIGDPETKAALKETLQNSAQFTRDLKELVADLKVHPWKLFREPRAEKVEEPETGKPSIKERRKIRRRLP